MTLPPACRLSRALPLFGAFLLGACASLPPPSPSNDRQRRADAEALAASPAQRALEDAERAFNGGDLDAARRHLAALPDRSLPLELLPRYQLLDARIAAAEGRPQEVLRRLPLAGLEAGTNAAAEALRAEALQTLGDPVAAVRAWVERRRWLEDSDAELDNDRRLWEGLIRAAPGPAEVARAALMGPEVEGWVSLAAQARGGTPAELADWTARFPGHPALAQWQALRDAAPSWRGAGGQPLEAGDWALLLPLSGPLAATGAAIRDGWIAAYLKDGARGGVRFLDTGGRPEGALSAYRQAVQEGVRLVVGPLRKEEIAALVQSAQLPVPVVALNQIDLPAGAPVLNLLQLGLSPEDEARAAAEHAVAEGLRSALLLLPEGDWGQRVEAAFRERLEALGGVVLDSAHYAPRTDDYSEAIKRLLRVGDSEARHRRLSGILGARPVFEPRRRGDVDFIFYAGRPTEGRQIWSQFRFHRAQDLPAYATAMVYDERATPGPDLAGSRFCDMGWLLDPQQHGELRRSAAAFESQQRQPRLFALGVDAYTLAAAVARGQAVDGDALAGLTGELWVGPDGVVRRRLDCARFTTTGIDLLPRYTWESRPPEPEDSRRW
jgi:outer membrane PBP1 activator LpoA protein